jgi:hypothetical protein
MSVPPTSINPIIPNVGPMLAAPTYITPDCMLAYCSTRLRNLDDQMQKQFVAQQKGIQESQQLDDIEGMLKDLFQKAPKDDKGNLKDDFNTNDYPAERDAIQTAINQIQDPAVRDKAQAAFAANAVLTKGSSFQDFKTAALDRIDAAKQTLSQGSELGMIGLQSLMSQRQTAIQLTTNLVQAMGESLKTVAGNVGK